MALATQGTTMARIGPGTDATTGPKGYPTGESEAVYGTRPSDVAKALLEVPSRRPRSWAPSPPSGMIRRRGRQGSSDARRAAVSNAAGPPPSGEADRPAVAEVLTLGSLRDRS